MNFGAQFTQLLGATVSEANKKELSPILENYGLVQKWLVGNLDAAALLAALQLEYQRRRRYSVMKRIYTRINQIRFEQELDVLWNESEEVPCGRRAES